MAPEAPPGIVTEPPEYCQKPPSQLYKLYLNKIVTRQDNGDNIQVSNTAPNSCILLALIHLKGTNEIFITIRVFNLHHEKLTFPHCWSSASPSSSSRAEQRVKYIGQMAISPGIAIPLPFPMHFLRADQFIACDPVIKWPVIQPRKFNITIALFPNS